MQYKEFPFAAAAPSHMHAVLWPAVREFSEPEAGKRVLDAGCGNGALCAAYLAENCVTVGIDLSASGVAIARETHPRGRFECTSVDEHVLERLGEAPFDLVVSTDVIEHLYDPRAYVRGCFAALKSGGRLIMATPYHGYLKNLAIALLGKWDAHANPLWDGGHIKLWSKATLGQLLREAGFTRLRFRGVGRLPWLWMSMVVSAEKP